MSRPPWVSIALFLGLVTFGYQWIKVTHLHSELRRFVWTQIKVEQSPDILRRMIVNKARTHGLNITQRDIRFFANKPASPGTQWRDRFRVNIRYDQPIFFYLKPMRMSVYRNVIYRLEDKLGYSGKPASFQALIKS